LAQLIQLLLAGDRIGSCTPHLKKQLGPLQDIGPGRSDLGALLTVVLVREARFQARTRLQEYAATGFCQCSHTGRNESDTTLSGEALPEHTYHHGPVLQVS